MSTARIYMRSGVSRGPSLRRFEQWTDIYLELGIRFGFLLVVRRFPHLHIHWIVESYVWFSPVLDWFSIQLEVVFKAYNFRFSDREKSIIILEFCSLHSSAG